MTAHLSAVPLRVYAPQDTCVAPQVRCHRQTQPVWLVRVDLEDCINDPWYLLTDWPVILAALARRKPGAPEVVERFYGCGSLRTAFLEAWARSRAATFRSVSDFTRVSNSTGAELTDRLDRALGGARRDIGNWLVHVKPEVVGADKMRAPGGTLADIKGIWRALTLDSSIDRWTL